MDRHSVVASPGSEPRLSTKEQRKICGQAKDDDKALWAGPTSATRETDEWNMVWSIQTLGLGV